MPEEHLQFYFQKKHGIFFDREPDHTLTLSALHLYTLRKQVLKKDTVDVLEPLKHKNFAPLWKEIAIRRADKELRAYEEALQAFHDCCRIEGIIPALESAHAIAYACKLAKTLPKDKTILVNLSGRGDKDMHTVAQATGSEG